MLDDQQVLRQRDPSDTLGGLLRIAEQASYDAVVQDAVQPRRIDAIVIAGMGGSALAADMVTVLTRGWLHVPLLVVKGYELPGFVSERTLVIAASHSGNTEETLQCYQQAQQHRCQVAVLTTGGELLQRAQQDGVPHVQVPTGAQPRMSTIYHLRGLLHLLQAFAVIDDDLYRQVGMAGSWLQEQVQQWAADVPMSRNVAKQLALRIAGTSPVIFAGELTGPVAYKWKINWNETAKNVAFANYYPEFNHNEFIGWSSHPVEKPFTIIDLRSSLERPRIRQRMVLSDQLLSGRRPQAIAIELRGDTLLQQLLWGLALGDAVSIYGAVLNGVDPEPVALVEQLKQELAKRDSDAPLGAH